MVEEPATRELVRCMRRSMEAWKRPSGFVGPRCAAVTACAGGLIERRTRYDDIDKDRTTVKRLADELG